MANRETKVSWINHWWLLRENKVTRIISVLQYMAHILIFTIKCPPPFRSLHYRSRGTPLICRRRQKPRMRGWRGYIGSGSNTPRYFSFAWRGAVGWSHTGWWPALSGTAGAEGGSCDVDADESLELLFNPLIKQFYHRYILKFNFSLSLGNKM